MAPVQTLRANASVLDRLLDGRPDEATDRTLTPVETIANLRDAVKRDVEALLNARRPWRSVPDRFVSLRLSPLGYGLADLTAGGLNDKRQQEIMRRDIETAIRRFEPRLADVHVTMSGEPSPLRATLLLRIDAILMTDPAPETISFDTLVDARTAEIVLQSEER